MGELEVEYVVVAIATGLAVVRSSLVLGVLTVVFSVVVYIFEHNFVQSLVGIHPRETFNKLANHNSRVPNRPGMWLSLVLLLLCTREDVVSECVCAGLLIMMLVHVLTQYLSCTYIVPSVSMCCTVVMCLVMNIQSEYVWTHTLTDLAMVISVHAMTLALLRNAPKSFTLGEAELVAQIIFLLVNRYLNTPESTTILTPELYWICWTTVMLSITLMTLLLVPICRKALMFAISTLLLTTLAILYISSSLDEYNNNPLYFALKFVWDGGKPRICLLLFWCICVLASVIFLQFVDRTGISTSDRKFLHLTGSLVAASGLQIDPVLTFAASIIVMCLFIVVEGIRCAKIGVFGGFLNDSSVTLRDYQEPGPLVLTPLYLMTSLFLPLWLWPVSSVKYVKMVHYCGIISVGVGDSFASVIGSTYGVRHWPGSKKTVLGTFSSCISMFLTLMLVSFLLRLQFTVFYVTKFAQMSVLCSLLETFSKQIDNFVLPIVAMLILY